MSLFAANASLFFPYEARLDQILKEKSREPFAINIIIYNKFSSFAENKCEHQSLFPNGAEFQTTFLHFNKMTTFET